MSGKLENKRKGVARNVWSLFPMLVINSFACETDEIDICAFPFTSTAVLLLDSRIWIPLRNRLLIISYNKSINVEIAKALVNSICC